MYVVSGSYFSQSCLHLFKMAVMWWETCNHQRTVCQFYTKSSCQRCFPDGLLLVGRPGQRQKAYGLLTFSGCCHLGADCSHWHPHSRRESDRCAGSPFPYNYGIRTLVCGSQEWAVRFSMPENHACYPITPIHHWWIGLEHWNQHVFSCQKRFWKEKKKILLGFWIIWSIFAHEKRL